MAGFDPRHKVHFDFKRGQVLLEGRLAQVLVPAEVLLALCQAAGTEAARDFGRRLGTEVGRRTSASLGDVQNASVEAVTQHMGGELALLGLGSLGVERWGNALVFTIDHSPPASAHLLGSIVEGALQRAAGRDTRVIVLVSEPNRVRLLVVNPALENQVGQWLSSGSSWGDVLARLNASTAERGEA